MKTKEEFIAEFNDPVYRRNLETEWWKQVRAHVRGNEVQVNMWHGHLQALTPLQDDRSDAFLALFGSEAQQQREWNPKIFDIHPKVVAWNRLAQVIWQIQHLWMVDINSIDEKPHTISIRWGFGHYELHLLSFTFRLPTEAEVRAVEAEPEEE